VVAVYEIQERTTHYRSPLWNVVEYLALFLIVTLHEFGHAMACRQVGGTADRIVLWPLGGVAYVSPPRRPGATLWSIAAGPLVNLALLPVLVALVLTSRSLGWAEAAPVGSAFLRAVAFINLGLLVFNLLPVYPLDGGQILRSLLWFVLGHARSLSVTAALGFVGVLGLVGLALLARSPWIAILAAFVALNCWRGLQQARALSRVARLPRHRGFACPSCETAPPIGNLWVCGRCRQPFDTFETRARCPHCGAEFTETRCADCGGLSPFSEWARASRVPHASPATITAGKAEGSS
jgi:Zn-dependent protease